LTVSALEGVQEDWEGKSRELEVEGKVLTSL